MTACDKCNCHKGNNSLKQMGWKLQKVPSVSFVQGPSHAELSPAGNSTGKVGCPAHSGGVPVQEPTPWQVGVLVGLDSCETRSTPREWANYLPEGQAIFAGDEDPLLEPVIA